MDDRKHEGLEREEHEACSRMVQVGEEQREHSGDEQQRPPAVAGSASERNAPPELTDTAATLTVATSVAAPSQDERKASRPAS